MGGKPASWHRYAHLLLALLAGNRPMPWIAARLGRQIRAAPLFALSCALFPWAHCSFGQRWSIRGEFSYVCPIFCPCGTRQEKMRML